MKKILFTLLLIFLASCGMDKEDRMIIHSMKMKYRDPALVGVWLQDKTGVVEKYPIDPYYLTFGAHGNYNIDREDKKIDKSFAYYTVGDTIHTYVSKTFKMNTSHSGSFRYRVVADTLFIYSGVNGISHGEIAPRGRYYRVKG